MKTALKTILILPALAYGVGFLGMIHPIFDSIAVFAVPLFWLSVIAALILGGMRSKGAILVCAILALAVLRLDPMGRDDQGGDYSLYQKNIWVLMRDPAVMVADIKASGADFVTLQEVSNKHVRVVDALASEYPSTHHCSSNSGGVAVLSRFVKVAGSEGCLKNLGLVYMQVITPAGPVWVASVHQRWPWPYDQARIAPILLTQLEKLDGPKVVAGDFNSVRWAHQMRVYEDRLDLQLSARTNSFHLAELLWIPIDHVLTPERARVTSRPFLGSDHLGLLAKFRLD